MPNALKQMIDQISRDKNVDPKVIISALEDAMVAAARKYFRTTEDFHSRYSPETGMIEVFAVKRVVEQITNPSLEISLEEAQKIDETSQINDTIEIPKPTEALGRIAAQTAKQVILQKVREAERDLVHKEYTTRVHEMVTGIVKRFEGPDIILDLERIEVLLPLKEQSRGERLRQNDRAKVVIVRVSRASRDPQVIVSRAHPALLMRLFEMEVPEIRDGIVVIKGIAREPGERSKIAVASTNKDIDPVGACVGIKGVRINAITRELRDEKIDIVEWSDDAATFAANALSPAKVSKVIIANSAERILEVIVEKPQLSLAIGKKGQNVRLASRLLDWEINVKSEEEKRKEVQDQMDQIASNSLAAQAAAQEAAERAAAERAAAEAALETAAEPEVAEAEPEAAEAESEAAEAALESAEAASETASEAAPAPAAKSDEHVADEPEAGAEEVPEHTPSSKG